MSKPIEIEFSKNEFSGALEVMQREEKNLTKYVEYLAKMKRTMYLSCLKEGFSEAQALEISKAWTFGS